MLKSYIMDTDGNVKLARHFKVKEFDFTEKEIDKNA
nr:MAG TPA: hypothetical protein [Microviridae sp.]